MRRGFYIAGEVVVGLHQLHQDQIVHLDLSSDNVVLDIDRNVKINQFGLSCLLDPNMLAGFVEAFGPSPYSPPETVRASLLVVLS